VYDKPAVFSIILVAPSIVTNAILDKSSIYLVYSIYYIYIYIINIFFYFIFICSYVVLGSTDVNILIDELVNFRKYINYLNMCI